MALKKPRSVAGAGFFGSLQVCFYHPGHMPSARTSVGNKEYEYKGKEKLAAQLQQHIDRDELTGLGEAAVAGVLRHVLDRKAPWQRLSTFF